MKYIVLDLEWNQGQNVPEEVRQQIPFEIIEIGAVKLNANREFEGEFQRLIKPAVYKKLFPITQSIVGIEPEELEEGIPFKIAIKEFFEWCGNDYQFCTWGTTDLTEIQRNMKYYGVSDKLTGVFPYCDVQKLFALQTEGRKNPRTLEYAVEYYGIKEKEDFHRALWDAEYTAKVFQRLDKTLIDKYFSLDYFNNPKTAEDEIYVDYGTYSKFISREFASKEDALYDKEIRTITCFLCGKRAARRIDWFSNNPKNYYCLGYCKEHGYLKGRIQMNKGEDGKRFVIKIVSRLNKEAAGRFSVHYRETALKKNTPL